MEVQKVENQFNVPSNNDKSEQLAGINPTLKDQSVLVSSKSVREMTKNNLDKLNQLTGKSFKL